MENKTVEESIATAMECDGRLLKYLPYIFQDFWELGASSDDIIQIVKKRRTDFANLNVLDLGSGKGAISVKLSAELGCKCFGIDAIDEFVAFSNNKAREYSIENICAFEKGDIRTKIKTLGKYDVIILGAIGTVFGNYYETLSQLSPHLNIDGLIIIDDAYIEDDCDKDYPGILRISDLLNQIKSAGMKLTDKIPINKSSEINARYERYEKEFQDIQKRCMELAEQYPADKAIFIEYVERQKEEYKILCDEIIPAMLVIGNAG